MNKLFLIAKHEYLRMVGKRSFVLGTLALPALIIGTIAISAWITLRGGSDAPLGYVDRAGILSAEVEIPASDDSLGQDGLSTEVYAYPDEESARSALESGEIQAYYVVPEDYLAGGGLDLVYWDDIPGEVPQDDFSAFVAANLVDDLPAEVAARVFNGPNGTVRSADGSREISESGIFNLFLPYFAGVFFILASSSAAQYLLRAVSDEKENRTVEILVTSLTPEQLIGGKAVGLISVALTQLFIWAVATAIGLGIGGAFIELLQSVEIPWGFILISLMYFVPSFVLMAGIMIGLGSTVTEYREGQQLASILNIFFMLPYFVLPVIIEMPNSPITALLTLFPTSSYVTVTVRWSMSLIPTWQIVTSLVLLTVSAVISVWAAARVFRAGMLRYGQRLRLAGVIAAIRGR